MASSRHPLTLFSNLNDSPIENAEASTSDPRQSAPAPVPVPVPILNFLVTSVEQTMAAQSNIDVNHYTLKPCIKTVTAVTNLFHRLQNKTSESLQGLPESGDAARQLMAELNDKVACK
ncbi:hypothetical protein ACSBR2_033249 [Camellia fascicularis]